MKFSFQKMCFALVFYVNLLLTVSMNDKKRLKNHPLENLRPEK